MSNFGIGLGAAAALAAAGLQLTTNLSAESLMDVTFEVGATGGHALVLALSQRVGAAAPLVHCPRSGSIGSGGAGFPLASACATPFQ